MEDHSSMRIPLVIASCVFFFHCAAPGEPAPDVTQVPPVTSPQEIDAWLAAGHFRTWACEKTPSSGIGHNLNTICSNEILVRARASAAEYPVDSASVKEMYDASGTKVIAVSMSRHTRIGNSGDAWFWFQRAFPGSGIAADENGLVANSWGDSPRAAPCSGCHRAAGIDANHSGHDFVYNVVAP
jgi:hypothetical protein